MTAKRLQIESIYQALDRAFDRGIIDDEDTAVIFHDLSFLESRIRELKQSFDKSALHTNAIKANPLISIQKFLNGLGIGAEAASIPELYIAQKAGFPAEKIVFDSPVKTSADLDYAIRAGVMINADSLDELERIDELLGKLSETGRYLGCLGESC